MIIIYKLYENSPFMRYNELKRSIGNISFKTLTSTLKELEEDNIIIRKEYPQIPQELSTVFLKRKNFDSNIEYDVWLGREK